MLHLDQSLCNMKKSAVGDTRASAQLENLQVFAVRSYPPQAFVRHFFAQTKIYVGEAGHVLVQHRAQPHVRQVVAPRQVQAGQRVHPRDQLPQGLPDAEDLDSPDATLDQRRNNERVQFSQVQPSFATFPDFLRVANISPLSTHLKENRIKSI